MKTKHLWIVIAVLAILLVGKAQQVNYLKSELRHNIPEENLVEYYQVTEELLEHLEYIDNLNDLDWGDLICETDIWEKYTDVKAKINR